MELPAEMFVKPVDGTPDLFQFRYDFALEGKAVELGAPEASVVTEIGEDGDLLIEGYAAVWDGDDRQGENFAPGSFANGLQKFLDGQAALCYHHEHDKCLGKVLDLREEGKGLYMKARVDGSIKDDPRLASIYKQIKRGTYNGLSTFGYFTRGIGALANKIVNTDLTEISITPVPVHPGTSLAVIAGKALVSDIDVPDSVKVDLPADTEEIREDDLIWLNESLNSIARILDRIEQRKTDDPAAA